MNVAYLLTGGNLGNREENLQKAKEAIGALCGEVVAASNIYETEAWGIKDQHAFLNQALKISTVFSAPALLEGILNVEQDLGRVRNKKYGPRIIDIDILMFNMDIIHQPGLSVPHPQLPYRRFALQCLADIGGKEIHPVAHITIEKMLEECTDPLTVNRIEVR